MAIHAHNLFGELLRHYRTRLAGERSRQEWLAKQLGYSKVVISKWETGDPSAALPSYQIILRIGRLYSLNGDEVNTLLEEARISTKSPFKAAQYNLLSDEQLKAWKTLYGPSRQSIDIWQEKLRSAQWSLLYCQLSSARHLAEELLDQIQGAISEESIRNLWSRDDLEEITRLWFLGWQVLYGTLTLLEVPKDLLLLTNPYLDQAGHLAMNSRARSELEILIWHVEGNLNHMLGKYATAMNCHRRVTSMLSNTGEQFMPYHLGAVTQRLIILDGPYALGKHDLISQIRQGRLLVDSLPDDSIHERISLLEAIGRSLSLIQDPDCWQVLEAAIEAAMKHSLGKALSGYLSTLCSKMTAIVNSPSQIDKDQLHDLGLRALIIAESNGWKQRVERVKQIANQGGVALDR